MRSRRKGGAIPHIGGHSPLLRRMRLDGEAGLSALRWRRAAGAERFLLLNQRDEVSGGVLEPGDVGAFGVAGAPEDAVFVGFDVSVVGFELDSCDSNIEA